MEVGDTVEVDGYTFTFRGARDFTGPNYQWRARLCRGQSQGGKVVAQMNPEKRVYRVQQNPMTEAAIDTHLTRDLYVVARRAGG